jgi:fibronectin-binding autotransporter adhesin
MKNLKNPKKDCGAQPNFKPVAAMAIASVMLCNSPAVADLLANWRLDETSGPALSDANATFSGTISGAIQNQPGKIGTAYSFSGGNYVNVNPGGASAPGAPAPSPTGTVSAWIQPTAGSWSGNIVYLQNPTFIQFRMEAANNLTYRQDGGRDRVVSTGAGAIADGVWTHVAATVSPSSIRLYINGSLITTGSGSNGYVSSNSTFLQIGSGAGQNFEGSIDDVAVWNTVLSEGMVGTLANTLAVNGGMLNDYNAFMMDKLFTAYDTGTPQSVDSTIGSLTWTKFTGETGTAGSVTYDAANLTYRAFFDSTSGVLTFGPLIIGNGTTNIGTVGSNVALRVNGSTAVANLTANVWTQSVSLNNGGSITGSFSLNQTGGVTANSGFIASDLTGSGGVTMNGNGNTLTLAGNNTYTGNTTISAGALVFQNKATRTGGSSVTATATGTVGLGVGGGGVTDYSDADVASLFNSTLNGFTLNAASGVAIDTTAGNFTQSTALTAARALTKLGSNTLTLSGNNTYTGATTVSVGTLTTSAADRISDSSAVTVASGATFQIGGSETVGSIAGAGDYSIAGFTLTAGGENTSTTVSGNITGASGALAKTGSGTLTLNGTNTYTGNTTITAGTLQVGANGTAGSLTSNITNNAALAFSRSDNSTYSGKISGTGALTKSGAGTLTLSGNNTYTGSTTISAGTLQIGNGGTTGSIIGNVTNNSSLGFNRSDEMTYSGQISGSGTLIKNGSGTLVFTGDNTYTGGTSVNDGTLYLRTDLFAAEGALFSMGNLTIASGATLMSERGNLAGSLTLNGGTWVENNGFGGSWSGSVSLGATSTFQSDWYQTVTANITGTGGLIKTGSGVNAGGVLTLTGNNTYTGNTTISAGTLKMNGSTSALSRFTVASGATLGGNGTIGGDTTIYGIHSPGNSPGIQTFSGNLTYALSGGNGPTVNWQLSGNTDTDFSAFDQIVVGGNLAFNTPTSFVLDFSGYGDVDWADPFWTTDQSWVIYDVTGTTTGFENVTIATANWADNSGDSFNTLLSGSAFSLGQQGNDLVLNYTAGTSAVPEPSQVAASLLLLSGIGIYVFIKRRRRGKSSLPTVV